MSRPPLFSIILPTHNRATFLDEAIGSVLAQTVGDFELIVVDDGSAIPAIIPEDNRMRLVRLPTNRGPAAARNAGIAEARGRFLTFLDDDDLFTSDRLETALAGLEQSPISICWGNFIDQDEPNRGRVLKGHVYDSILDGPTPTLGCGAVRRDLVVPFDERWHAVEDVVWWLAMTAVAPVNTVPKVGYRVRRHQGPRNRNHLEARVEENYRFLELFDEYFSERRKKT